MMFHNDDLSGFFTSVPQSRITAAVQELIEMYCRKHPPNKKRAIWFTVSVKLRSSMGRTVRGKSRKATSSYKFCLDDIPAAVALSFAASYFTVFGLVFQQIHGSCIGSPISPTLCNITVAITEYHWLLTGSTLLNNVYMNRYVDNRATIHEAHLMNYPEIRRLLHLDLYVPPVQLKQCGNEVYLGQTLNLHDGTISYVLPQASWQLRSHLSAGSLKLTTMGLQARLHIIYRDSDPRYHAHTIAKQLAYMYVQQGHHHSQVFRLLHKVSSRYRTIAIL
jgi:hypothetical protein